MLNQLLHFLWYLFLNKYLIKKQTSVLEILEDAHIVGSVTRWRTGGASVKARR